MRTPPIALAALALAACRDKPSGQPTTSPPPAAPAASIAPAAPRYHAHDVTNGHHVFVDVTFIGKKTPTPFHLPAPYKDHCNTLDVPDEALSVDAKGGVNGAVVWLDDVTEGEPPPDDPVIQDQKGCVFSPHVIAAAVTQPLHLSNSDPSSHAVRIDFLGDPPIDQLNRVLGSGLGMTIDPRPEWAGHIGKVTCPIHLWMSSWMLFFDHPYFDVTAAGHAKLDKVPPGHHELAVWHEGVDAAYDGNELHVSKMHVTKVPIDVAGTDVTRAFTMDDDGVLVAK